MGSRALWLWIFVGSLGVTAVFGVAALLLPRVPFEEEALITAGLLTAYSLAGLATVAAIGRGRTPILSWSAVVLLSASLAGWLTEVWFDRWFQWRTEQTILQTSGTLTTLGILALHSALLALATISRTISRAVRTGTITTAILGATMFIGLIWEVWYVESLRGDLYERAMGALFILASLGTIATPILARIESATRREGEEHTIGKSVPVHLRCPRCGVEQELPANRKGRCQGCGLKMSVQVSEPRCRCGYLLYGLPEAVCPECGRQIADEHRWPSPDPDQS